MKMKSVRNNNTLDLSYIRIVRIFTYFIGAWPGDIFGEKLPLVIKWHRIQVLLSCTLSVLGQIYYLFSQYDVINFMDIGLVYINTSLATVTLVRSSLPRMKKYSELSRIFFLEFHLFNYKHKGEFYKKVNDTVDKVSYFFSIYQMVMMVIAMCLFNLSPMYHNYVIGAFTGRRAVNSTLEFAVFFAYPGFYPQDHFLLVTGIDLYLSYICATAVCSIDLLLFLMVFQILGHIAIMKNNLNAIPESRKSRYSYKSSDHQEENDKQRFKLIEIIKHHNEINRFVDAISDLFGPMLAINYLFHLFNGCVLLLECSQLEPNALLRFGPLTIIIFSQLVQVSVVFELVNSMSETLGDSVYCVPWECMSVDNQRCVRLFLQKVQTPIQLTAMGVVPVGVRTMTSIIKTTMSYFVFLRQKNN